MLILSRVCAEFREKSGRPLLTITPERLLSFIEAPDAIREDPLFFLLISDGSLEAVQSVPHQKALEADPVAGTTAEGKKEEPAAAAEERKEVPAASNEEKPEPATRRKAKKPEPAAHDNP